MKQKKRMKRYIAIILIMAFSMLTFNNINYAKAYDEKLKLDITYKGTNKTSSQDVNGQVNEEITATYTVTPRDIDVRDLNPSTAKEIVLVLDTSGSMNDAISNEDSTVRMDALKDAAKSFIGKLATESNVKIGIVNYSDYANYNKLSMDLTSSNNSSLITKIDEYHPKYWQWQWAWGWSLFTGRYQYKKWYQTDGNIEGATNTGDGIREAIKKLDNGTNARKYIVLMSDGEPTKYTYYGDSSNPNYYTDQTSDSYTKKYGGTGNSDDDGRANEYAKVMSRRMKDKGYSNFEIAYSSGGSSDKMKQLKQEAGGNFYSALDKDAIKKVYDSIADQIKSDYLLEGIKFNFTLPEGLQYAGPMTDIISHNGNTYVQQLPNISYRLSADKKKYTADPFDIYIKFKATKSGAYTNLGQGWTVTYNDIDEHKTLVTKTMPTINYSASSVNIGFNLNKTISGNLNITNIGEKLQLNYSITPNDIDIPSRRKSKKVVLVVDSAYSQKNNVKNFLNNFANISDVNFALITYGTGANITNFGTADLPKYFVLSSNSTLSGTVDSIGSISDTPGSNLGDGLRKALYLLKDTDDTDKEIVVFGEKNPDYYSYIKNSDGQVNYYSELDNLSGTITEDSSSAFIYGKDTDKAKEYADNIASKIVDTKDLNISLFTAGDDVNDEVIKSISSKASTEFTKISLNDDILKLKNYVNSDLVLNSSIKENFPNGIELEAGGTAFEKNIKVFYSYDNTTKKYTSSPIPVSTTIKSNDIGNMTLSPSSKFYFTNLEGLELNENFPSKSITVQSTSSIKQGLFFSNQSMQQGNLGESYINSNASNLTLNSNINMGTLVRSSLKHLVINIDISHNVGDALQISDLIAANIKVYKVGDNNALQDTSITPLVTGQNITITIDNDTVQDRSYIINYNYKAQLNTSKFPNEEKLFSTYSSVIFNNRCTLNDNTTDTFNYNIVGSPDLF